MLITCLWPRKGEVTKKNEREGQPSGLTTGNALELNSEIEFKVLVRIDFKAQYLIAVL